MARPRKRSVDYFPHDSDASEGVTLSIIQHHFGNDGYAFWFRLLELLARTPGHVFDCRNPSRWEFLQAITHTTEKQAENILEKLADLDAICPQLWGNRVIWAQNFVQGIAEVYKNRHQEIPQKPVINSRNDTPDGVSTPHNPTPDGVSTPNLHPETPQSKVNYSKVNKSIHPPPPPQAAPSALLTTTTTTGLPALDHDFSEVTKAYEANIGLLTPIIGDTLKDALSLYPAGWIIDAFKVAVTNETRKWAYAESILKRWKQEGKDDGKGRGPKEKFRQKKGVSSGYTGLTND